MTGRISVEQPSVFHGVRSAHSIASSRSRTSRKMKPPRCSLVSMNGPSVIWRLPPSTRIVVAVCACASPSHASSTPASLAASPNASHAAISPADSSCEKSSGPRSSPYSVSSTFMSHLRGLRRDHVCRGSCRGRTTCATSTAPTRQLATPAYLVGERHRPIPGEVHQRGRALELGVLDEVVIVELAFVEADRTDVEAAALLDELLMHPLDGRLRALADRVHVAAHGE